MHPQTTAGLTFGEQLDAITARMNAAYDERRRHKYGTAEYDASDAVVNAVYADLSALNKRMAGRSDRPAAECGNCDGTGEAPDPDPHDERWYPCPVCGGSGEREVRP